MACVNKVQKHVLFFFLENVSENVARKISTNLSGANINNSILTWNSVHVTDDSNING